MESDWAVVITAAGSSRRMGDGVKKEFARIDGEPVIRWSVSRFLLFREITHIVITSRAEEIEITRSFFSPGTDGAKILFTAGGPNRQASVRLGLETLASVTPRYVLIHDGARPWASSELISKVMAGVVTHGACVPVVRSPDALKRVVDGRCVAHPGRDEILCVQTPQGFTFQPILEAHRRFAVGGGFGDDAELFAASGGEVYTTPGDPMNRKITYQHDLNRSDTS